MFVSQACAHLVMTDRRAKKFFLLRSTKRVKRQIFKAVDWLVKTCLEKMLYLLGYYATMHVSLRLVVTICAMMQLCKTTAPDSSSTAWPCACFSVYAFLFCGGA